jgi:PAS domain S-box-containing protein
MESAAPWSPWAAIATPLVRRLLGFGTFCVAYLAAYRFGMAFSPAVSAPFWFPDSILLCGLLSTRTRHWWLLIVVTLPIRLAYADHPNVNLWFLLSVFVNDSAKGLLAAWLLRRYMRDPIRLHSMRDLGVYCAIAVLLVPALSAFGGAASRAMLGHAYWASFEQWFLGNAMAHLIVTPILFYWLMRPPNPAALRASRALEVLALAIGLLVSLTFAFEAATPARDLAETRFYAPVPFMVWAAIRFRMVGATAVVAALTVFAVHAAITRSGSFEGMSSSEVANHLQHFLLLRVAPLYLAAVLLEQWAQVSNSLRESEQRFRNIANEAPMMCWTSDRHGGNEFASQQWLKFTGRTQEQTGGAGWSDSLHPDDRKRVIDYFMRQLEQRLPVEIEFRLRRHDGEYRWMHVQDMPSSAMSARPSTSPSAANRRRRCAAARRGIATWSKTRPTSCAASCPTVR